MTAHVRAYIYGMYLYILGLLYML